MQQEQKKPVGRPPADEPKTEHIRIRVTKSEKAMLKHSGVNMSDLINKGLYILMPTLGKKWNGKEWEKFEDKGTAANLVAYKGICHAIEMQMDIWQSDPDGFSFENAELLKLLRSLKLELDQHCTFHAQK